MSSRGGFSVGLWLWSFEWMTEWKRPRIVRHDRGAYYVGISIWR